MRKLVEAVKAGDPERAKEELAKLSIEPTHHAVRQLVRDLDKILPGQMLSKQEEEKRNHKLKSKLVGVITSEMILRAMEKPSEAQKEAYRQGLIKYLMSEQLSLDHGVTIPLRKEISGHIIKVFNAISDNCNQSKFKEREKERIQRHLANGGRVLTLLQH